MAKGSRIGFAAGESAQGSGLKAQSGPQITPVKFASLHIFDIFNRAGADYTDYKNRLGKISHPS
jgi:hypothetical protein